MKKSSTLIMAATFCLASGFVLAAGEPKPDGGKPSTAGEEATPTQDTVVALADKYRERCEAQLDFQSKQTIDEMNRQLAQSKSIAFIHKRTIDGLVNQLTMALAGLKNFDTLTVASAILVKAAPRNPRTTNLFGSVLHTSDRIDDSVTVFEYTLSLKPDSTLATLNLANAYLDVNEDEKAKALADKVVFKDPDNTAAHRVLATYWYRKHNLGAFGDELLKASRFKGYVKKKTDHKKEQIEEESSQPNDSTDVLEQKAKKLKDEVPLTTADIIEDEFPSQARQIRDKYGKLVQGEKMVMPKLPTVNMDTPADYRRNEPIIVQWAQVFEDRAKKNEKDEAAWQGIDTNASDAVQEAQADAFEKKQAAEAMQQGLQALQTAKGMPGVDEAEVKQAIADLKKEMQEEGIKPESSPASAPATPVVDSGSQLALSNYGNYLRICGTYGAYLGKYYGDFGQKVSEIVRVYRSKVQAEEDYFSPRWEKLQREHNQPDHPHGLKDIPCREEQLRHKKALNVIAETYYKQWINLYAPEYAQKMKPTLDAYWNICMLYVRNMNDPKVMEREYRRVKHVYLSFASIAGSQISGNPFSYEGPTDEEEAQLRRDVSAAEQEAREKKPQMEKDFQEPGIDWSQWVEDHLVLEVSGEFLSLKITATTIKFEAWAFGPGAGMKIDMVDEKLETYTSLGTKLKVGVNIGGVDLGVDARVDVIRKVAKWDFENGTYEDSYGGKGEAKVAFGPIAFGGEVEVDTELNAKAAAKITAADLLTVRQVIER